MSNIREKIVLADNKETEEHVEPMTLEQCKDIIESYKDIIDQGEYAQISDDWRHRDNLTWQIPSVIVVIVGATLVAAYKIDINPQFLYIVRGALLSFAFLLSSCLTYALYQNLRYQMGSTLALKRIISGEGIPEVVGESEKWRRALNPADFTYEKKKFWKESKTRLRGSFILWLLCMLITTFMFIMVISFIILLFTKTDNLQKVLFEDDKSYLTVKAKATLDKNALWLQEHPEVIIRIEGHSDERGTDEYNLTLGERRAKRVRNYLISLKIAPSRLFAISYGKERPALLGNNERVWAQNRRVELKIIQ